jgi:hypothetical protein
MLKTSYKYRLHILDNGSIDSELQGFLQYIAKKHNGYYKHYQEAKPLSECYNFLLQTVYQENCVFFPVNSLVDYDWLEDHLCRTDFGVEPWCAYPEPELLVLI